MKGATSAGELTRLVDMIDAEFCRLDEHCGPQPSWATAPYQERAAWFDRQDAELGRIRKVLEAEGARFVKSGAHDHAIRLAGIRSTSTSGWQGAIRNWQAAARKRVAAEDVR